MTIYIKANQEMFFALLLLRCVLVLLLLPCGLQSCRRKLLWERGEGSERQRERVKDIVKLRNVK